MSKLSVLLVIGVATFCAALSVPTQPKLTPPVCQVNTYFEDGACVPCPKHSSTQGFDANISPDQCVCDPGYIKNDDTMRCEPCPANTFSANRTTCLACPEASTTHKALATSSIDGCVCPDGYQRGPDPKLQFCITCGQDFYGVNGTCNVCPSNSTTVRLSTATAISQCVCASGYARKTGKELGCVLCPADHYASSEKCVACPPHASADALIPRASVDACACVSGYAVDNRTGNCAPCARDTYGVDGVCYACPLNSTTKGVVAAEVVTRCKCQAGYFIIDGVGCAECPADTYGPDGRCIKCGANETTAGLTGRAKHSDCGCLAGYIRDGRNICQPCPINTYQEGNQCLTCPVNTTTNGTVGNPVCKCRAGYGLNDNVTCTECPVDTYSNSSKCVVCPANSHTYDMPGVRDVAGCVCTSGYFNVSRGQCQVCPKNTFGKLGQCHTCPEYSSSDSEASPNIADCKCNGGYKRLRNKCVPCEADTYSSSEECVACHAHSHTVQPLNNGNASACVCDNGFELSANDTCVECPENMYGSHGNCYACPSKSHTNKRTGVKSVLDCECEPGYAPGYNGACEVCDVDHFSHKGQCELCPANSHTNDHRAVASRDGCVCRNGAVMGLSNDCQPCIANFTLSSDDVCVECPAHSSTVSDQRSRGCVCLPGYGADHLATCHKCPADQYGYDGQCNLCPALTTTHGASGAKALSDCVCIPGFTGTLFGSPRCVSSDIEPLEVVGSLRIATDMTRVTPDNSIVHVIAALAHIAEVHEDNVIISGISKDVIDFRVVPETNTLLGAQAIVHALTQCVVDGTFLQNLESEGFVLTNVTYEHDPMLQMDRVPLKSYFSQYTAPVDTFDKDIVAQLCLEWIQSNRMDLNIILQRHDELSIQSCDQFCGMFKLSGTTPLVPEFHYDKWPHPVHALKDRVPQVPLAAMPSDVDQRSSFTSCYALCRTSGLRQFVNALGSGQRHDPEICLDMFQWH